MATRIGEFLRPLVTLAPSPPRLPNAIKAGLTVLLCLSVPMLFGRLDLGLLTVPGTFAVLYAPAAPLRRRAATVAGVGLGLVVSTTLGAFTAGSYLAFTVTAVVLASLTAGLCLAFRVGPPGSYFLVLTSGIAYLVVGDHGVEPVMVPAMTAVGAAVAWVVTMADLLPDPGKPERRAVRTAREVVADYVDTEPGPASRPQHRAAVHALADAEEAVTEGMWTRSREIDAELAAARRDYDVRAARAVRHIVPGDDPEWDPRNPDAGRWPDSIPGTTDVEVPSAEAAERVDRALSGADLRHIGPLGLRFRSGLRWPGEPWSVAASVGIATAVSSVLLVILAGTDQPHPYWVIAFSALVLHQGGPRVTRTYRALHRLTGTIVGLGLFLLVLLVEPSGWWLIAVIVALQFSIELLVTRNYGLAVTLITPLALLIASGGTVPEDPLRLVGERLLDTVVGVLVALAVLWGLGRRAHHRAVRADTRRAIRAIARYLRTDGPTAGDAVLASALRNLHSSTSLLSADGYGDSAEARTSEAVVNAGFLLLGAGDRHASVAGEGCWDELAAPGSWWGWRPAAPDDPVDQRIREQCQRVGVNLD